MTTPTATGGFVHRAERSSGSPLRTATGPVSFCCPPAAPSRAPCNRPQPRQHKPLRDGHSALVSSVFSCKAAAAWRACALAPAAMRLGAQVGPGAYELDQQHQVVPASVPFQTGRDRNLLENNTTSAITPGKYQHTRQQKLVDGSKRTAQCKACMHAARSDRIGMLPYPPGRTPPQVSGSTTQPQHMTCRRQSTQHP